MAYCLGIDLGTSTTCVSVVRDEEPEIVAGPDGGRVIPSYLHVREDGKLLVGEAAKAELTVDPYSTVWATKRLLGRKADDPQVKECIKRLTYRIGFGKEGQVLIQSRGRVFPPEWVASVILNLAVRNASSRLGESVKKAVITVPGTFKKEQRDLTRKAAEKVGIEVVRLMAEPTAAAVAWGYHKESDQTVAVFDLGGGTFDVFVMQIGGGSYRLLATRGESWLGGEDFDNKIVERVAKDFRNRHKLNLFTDKIAHQRLKTASEKAKIQLSEAEEARIFIPSIMPDINRVADVDYNLTREEYERMVAGLVDRAVARLREAVADAGLSMHDLDNVIMVGGMSRVPLVRKKVAEVLGREPDCSVNPDEAVARGAAIVGAGAVGKKVRLSPPPSTRPQDEYLGGDVDIEAMYAQAVQRNQEPGEWSPEEDGASLAEQISALNARGGTAQVDDREAAAIAGARKKPAPAQEPPAALQERREELPARDNAPAGMTVEVMSQYINSDDVPRMFFKTGDERTAEKRLQGGFAIGTGGAEQARIKVHAANNGRERPQEVIGEFIVQAVQNSPGAPAQVRIFFNVDKKVPFSVKTADSD